MNTVSLTMPEHQSKKETARLAGVARTTLDHALQSPERARLATLHEIALASGFDLVVSTRPIYNLLAAAAARTILTPSFAAPEGTAPWVARMRRWVQEDPWELGILESAARAAPVGNAPIKSSFATATVMDAATCADAAGGEWAISGAQALSALGISIVWTTRHEVTTALIQEEHPLYHGEDPQVVVLPAPNWLLQGSYLQDGLRYVDPTQMIIDGLCLGGNTGNAARKEALSWLEDPGGK